ncbi:hypothetical protein HY095_00170 [Candidatus Micrarchaeota archaeon]|nr:hypothetical protein [Candidatus Micrarchaeota archaeon]
MERSQAALFDGIMLLLFASASVAMLYSFLNGYGVAQDNALRSAYVSAYLQDVGKSIFYINAASLADVARTDVQVTMLETFKKDSEASNPNVLCNPASKDGCPYADLATPSPSSDQGCGVLRKFGISSVADLLKKDLGDKGGGLDIIQGEPFTIPHPDGSRQTEHRPNVCFDDKFGHPTPVAFPQNCISHGSDPSLKARWDAVPTVPGKTALRCAMKELMKPFEQAGYKYFVDVLDNSANPVYQQLVSEGGYRITNHWQADAEGWIDCQDAINKGLTDRLTSVAIPFRVTDSTTLSSLDSYQLRICIWPGRK